VNATRSVYAAALLPVFAATEKPDRPPQRVMAQIIPLNFEKKPGVVRSAYASGRRT
jgi:hypothetical protein